MRALVDAGHEVVVAVTRPDRRRGRGPATSPSPVKAAALASGVPVVHGTAPLLELAAGPGELLGVVVAYGRIVPEHVLARVPMVNVHFSLLPRWRGAAPVERAILAGDQTTGVSIMALEPELDTGPVYARAEVPIAPGEHAGSLRSRLADAGIRLLLEVLGGPLPEPSPQRGEPTYADKIAPGELELRWDRPAVELERVVRLDGAWTRWRGRRLRVLDAEAVPAPLGAAAHDRPPGTLFDGAVLAGEGALRLVTVQPEGRAPMPAAAWLRGARPVPGDAFTSS